VSVKVDLAGVSYMDSAGVLALFRLEEKIRRKGRDFGYAHVPSRIQGIMELISREDLKKPPLRPESKSEGIIETVGDAGFKAYCDFRALMTFLGDLVAAVVYLASHPQDVRWAMSSSICGGRGPKDSRLSV